MQRFKQWFLGPGQYWVLAIFGLVTLLSFKARYGPVMGHDDESTYLDVILTLPDNLVAQRGEFIGMEIREKFACDGIHYIGTVGPDCGADYSDPALFPQEGKTTADAYTPVFFWFTWLVARLLALFGIDMVIGARMAMIFFVLGAVLVLYKTMRMLAVPIAVAYSVSALLLISPRVFWISSFVSTDAPVLLFGALALYVAVRYLSAAGSLWPLVAVAATGMLFKITTILAIFLVGLMVLSYHFAPKHLGPRQSVRSWLIPGLTAIAAAIAVLVAWEVIRNAIALGDSPDQGIGLARPALAEAVFQTQAALSHLVSDFYGLNPDQPWTFLVTRALTILLIGGVLAMMMRQPKSRLEVGIGWGTGIASVTALPILLIVVSVLVLPFSIPTRYGLALLPAFFLSLALAVRFVWARWLLVGIATTSWLWIVFAGSYL